MFAPSDARRHAVGLARQQNDGEDELALKQFEKALELDPAHIPSLYHRGLMFLDYIVWTKLLMCLALYWRMLPTIAWCTKVEVFHQDLRKHQDAVDDFTSALKIDRTVGENHYHRGESLLRLGDLNGAILDFKSAVELKYSDPLVFNARGMTKRALGHFDEAIDDLTDAVQHAPTNIEFLLNRSLSFWTSMILAAQNKI